LRGARKSERREELVIYGIFIAGVLVGIVAGFIGTVRLLSGTVPKGYAAKVENVRFPIHGRRRHR
jgi:hypothetical protein